MAKDKTVEANYKAIGKQRMRLRKEKRNNQYRRESANSSIIGRSISQCRDSGSWYDENSPTMMSQVCEMGGTCQSPCNGDC